MYVESDSIYSGRTYVELRNYQSQRISVIDITLSRIRMQYDKST